MWKKNEKTMNVRKSSRLVAEAEKKRRKEKRTKVKEERTRSQSVLIVLINNGTTYLFRGFIRRQNSVLGARNKFDT